MRFHSNHRRQSPADGQGVIRLAAMLALGVAICLWSIALAAAKSPDQNTPLLRINEETAERSQSSVSPDKSTDESQQMDFPYCRSGFCGGDAKAAVVYNGDLIVGGGFVTADGQTVNRIARWDGTAWHDIGGVTGGAYSIRVYALCVYNGELIVGGRFEHAGGVAARNIAAWDGSSWHALGEGVGPLVREVYSMCVYNGQLIAAGNFETAGGVAVHDLAAWNGSYWYDLPGLNAEAGMMVAAVTVYGDKLIATGNFQSPPGRIAAWNGSSWSSLGAGITSGFAETLIEYDSLLIAGGYFAIDGVTDHGIAAWNGSEWFAIGSGITNEVTNYQGGIACFHVHDGRLIVGGYFSNMDGIRVNHIAAWDGTTWSTLGSGMGGNTDCYANAVNALTSYNGVLVAGGAFTKNCFAPGNRIAGWDGSSWHEITAGGMPFAFMIEGVNPYGGVSHGEPISVGVTKVGGTDNMHGFDLLIGYDTEALTLTGVTPGPLFDKPGDFEWDYFEYRDEAFEGCNGDCPSGLVRIIGVAELNDGSGPAISFKLPDGNPIFTLNFTVTEDTTINCKYTPIKFFWVDCGDNAVALDSGDLGVSDEVWRFGKDGWENIADPGDQLPTSLGAPDSCLFLGENQPTRFVNLVDATVRLSCNINPTLFQGDVNINGIGFEIADWVMYTNFFLYGFVAFGSHISASVAASDINNDGIVLTVEDLVYLGRVISIGPYSNKASPADKVAADTLFLIQDLSTRTVSFDYNDSLAAVFLVFNGDITPQFSVDTSQFLCSYWYNGENTCVLIQPPLNYGFEQIGLTAGPLFTYSGLGRLVATDNQAIRTTGAADFQDDFFTMIPNSPTTIVITGGNDGSATVDPHPVPRSLARISGSETVAISLGNFAEHDINDVDLASLRVNDTIVPLSTSLVPPQIVVPARSFINSYYFGPDTAEYVPPLHRVMDTLSTRSFVFSVSGSFTDASSFVSLGDATIFNTPVTIPVPSGWSTIAAAVGAAESQDTVEVADGTFTGDGNRDITLDGKSLIIRSAGGPAMTTIDCGGSESDPHRAFISTVDDESGTTIEGFNIIHGYHGSGGAISLVHSDLTIRNCTFQLNESDQGGALYIHGASPLIESCLFFHNQAANGGAILCWASSQPTIRNCTFSNNTGTASGSVLYCYISLPTLENTLIAFNNEGETVYSLDGSINPHFSCCDIYGNDGGDWTGGIADQLGTNGNFSEDPEFCDTTFIDFHIDGNSPCSATNNACLTLIGKYNVGCGVRCGDINLDGAVNIADPVYLIAYLFASGPEPPVFWASDLNGNLELDIGDAVWMINFIFKGSPVLDCVNN